MLSYKRYKELKARLRILIVQTRYSKVQIRYSSRVKDQYTLILSLRRYKLQKDEINYITEICRLHKILWKQHLCLIEFNKG